MHTCTDEDYAKFHPVGTDGQRKLNSMRRKGGLFCLDWAEHGHDIWGTWKTGKHYAAVEIMAVPCGHEYTAYDGTVERAREDCNWDKKKLREYLGET